MYMTKQDSARQFQCDMWYIEQMSLCFFVWVQNIMFDTSSEKNADIIHWLNADIIHWLNAIYLLFLEIKEKRDTNINYITISIKLFYLKKKSWAVSIWSLYLSISICISLTLSVFF